MRSIQDIEGDLDAALQQPAQVKNKRCIELHGELDRARDELDAQTKEVERLTDRLLYEVFHIPKKEATQ